MKKINKIESCIPSNPHFFLILWGKNISSAVSWRFVHKKWFSIWFCPHHSAEKYFTGYSNRKWKHSEWWSWKCPLPPYEIPFKSMQQTMEETFKIILFNSIENIILNVHAVYHNKLFNTITLKVWFYFSAISLDVLNVTCTCRTKAEGPRKSINTYAVQYLTHQFGCTSRLTTESKALWQVQQEHGQEPPCPECGHNKWSPRVSSIYGENDHHTWKLAIDNKATCTSH